MMSFNTLHFNHLVIGCIFQESSNFKQMMNMSCYFLYLFTDKDRQTILALKNNLFRVKCWQSRLCTSGSLPFHTPIDSVTGQSGAHLLARGSEIIERRCHSHGINHTKMSHKYLLFYLSATWQRQRNIGGQTLLPCYNALEM